MTPSRLCAKKFSRVETVEQVDPHLHAGSKVQFGLHKYLTGFSRWATLVVAWNGNNMSSDN
jgi:hypothetical protein